MRGDRRYYGRDLFVAGYLFRTEVDDYIEQVEVAPGVSTFVNRAGGTIEGVELEGAFALPEGLRLTWAGQQQRGRDGGEPLASIPADRVEIGLSLERGRWSAQGRLQHRFAKDDPGAEETAIGDADLLSAAVGYRIGEDLELRVHGSNLLDETYLPSADELAVPGPGRSLGLSLRWR